MPRPRKGVTAANLLQVDRYFLLALKDNRLFTEKSPMRLSLVQEAKDAYNKLPPLDWKTESTRKHSLVKRQLALQEWIDKFIPPKKWQRCLLTLRQNKSRKKHKLRRLDLPLDTYLIIKALAQKQQLTLSATIYNLAKPVFNKLFKSEYEKELGISKMKKGIRTS